MPNGPGCKTTETVWVEKVNVCTNQGAWPQHSHPCLDPAPFDFLAGEGESLGKSPPRTFSFFLTRDKLFISLIWRLWRNGVLEIHPRCRIHSCFSSFRDRLLVSLFFRRTYSGIWLDGSSWYRNYDDYHDQLINLSVKSSAPTPCFAI